MRRRTKVSATLAERLAFFSIEAPSGCREWTGSTDGRMGYGKLTFEGVVGYAHRWSWMLHHGQPIPDGLVVMHLCDNPRCVNPAHLSIGTQLDNVRDQIARGRSRRCTGSSHALSTLTADDVATIRRRSAGGEMRVTLAREFKVSATTIWRIANHRSYKETAA